MKVTGDKMKIILGSDHAGYEKKEKIKLFLSGLNYQVEDMGTTNLDSVDYPDYAFTVGEKVVSSENTYGILICGTGIGMSIACNKVRGIRCAKVSDTEEAYFTRSHNNANVIALSSKMDEEEMEKAIHTFLTTEFSNEERHIRRIEKITSYEKHYDN